MKIATIVVNVMIFNGTLDLVDKGDIEVSKLALRIIIWVSSRSIMGRAIRDM